MNNLKQLRRQRAYVFIGVIAGIGVSIAMNVLHAPDNHWARLVAAIPPLAVFASLEIIVRIPSSSLWLSIVRIFGAFTVASGAAAISYAQQRAAVLGLGFPQWQSYFWPAIIDGLMIVTSVSLVEVVRLIRKAEAVGRDTAMTVEETVNAIADGMPVPVSPAGPVVFQAPDEPDDGEHEERRGGRSGPQTRKPVMSPLDPSRVLWKAPPQV